MTALTSMANMREKELLPPLVAPPLSVATTVIVTDPLAFATGA